jgi:hydroxymethylglutaryl-CoA synthase
MSELSGPIARRKVETTYRLIGSQCEECGRKYFPPKEFCGFEGRKSRMKEISFFDDLGEIVSGSTIRETTKKFSRLVPYVSVITSFDGIRIPGRLTDLDPNETNKEFDISKYIGRKVFPVFRRIYEQPGGIITYSSLNFVDQEYHKFVKNEPILEQVLSQETGIVGYGVYIPRFRLKVSEIAKRYGKDPVVYEKGLGLIEKAVVNLDEDSVTMAVEAGRRALVHSGLRRDEIKEVYAGSESNPYAVKPIMASVIEALGLGDRFKGGYSAGGVDSEFACKAATALFKAGISITNDPRTGIENCMVIGTDNSQAQPGDDLDYSVGAGAAAFIFGKKGVIAKIKKCVSYTTDTADFYRRDLQPFPRHEDRFTGEPAYFKHVVSCGELLLQKTGLKPKDIDYAVFHQPNSKFPERAATILGFSNEQIAPSQKVNMIGNTYSASCLIGLAGVLDVAEPGDKIFMVSYGSGAGSDGYLIEVEKDILEKRERGIKVDSQIKSDKKIYVDYDFYRKSKGNI